MARDKAEIIRIVTEITSELICLEYAYIVRESDAVIQLHTPANQLKIFRLSREITLIWMQFQHQHKRLLPKSDQETPAQVIFRSSTMSKNSVTYLHVNFRVYRKTQDSGKKVY